MTNPTVTNTHRLHDERLLELARDVAKADSRLASAADTLRRISGQHKHYRSRTVAVWVQSRKDFTHATIEDAIEWATEHYNDAYVPQYMGTVASFLDEYMAREAELLAARSAYDEHEAAYTGWSRYWLCLSNNGHVHKAYCSSFRPTTRVALVPSLSGASIESCVEVLGPSLCSKCFPDAPVEWQNAVKIPESVATVLADQGEEAFRKALDEWKTKQAAKAAKAVK